MNPNCVQRTSSTVALQSLALLNSDFVRARAKAFGARIMREASTQPDRLDRAFRLAIGRPPTAEERDAAEEFLRAQAPASNGAADAAQWTDFCQMIFASNAFLFVD